MSAQLAQFQFKTPPHTLPAVGRQPLVLALCCATVLLWVALAAWLNASQLNDSLEQFVWGQSLEWGYWKHPPLTSWLMWTGLRIFGPGPQVTYLLAGLLVCLTLLCTWRAAEMLFGSEVAILTALLFTLHYGFTRRAQVYNHNTVLVACIAVTVLLTLLALRHPGWGRWVLVGLAAGLSVLAKYQAIAPLLGMLLAIALSGQWRRAQGGVAIAVGVGLCVVAPHLAWAQQNGFKTVHYALHYAQGVDGAGLATRAHGTVAFLAMQLKYFFPALVFGLLLWLVRQWSGPWRRVGPVRFPTEQRAWLLGLLGVPLAVVAVSAWVGGVKLQSHWGLQTTQFGVLLLAGVLHQRFGPLGARHLQIWAVIQAVTLGVFVAQGLGWWHGRDAHTAVRDMPARQIATEAMDFWAQRTGCELRYLSGPSSVAGMVAAYARHPVPLAVLEDGDVGKSPWIDRDKMAQDGSLELQTAHHPVMAPDALVLPLRGHTDAERHAAGGEVLVVKFVPPTRPCAPPGLLAKAIEP